ncbi:MAG: hypothetical protein ACLFS3_00550 [Candidatus Aenigmatarchaeota archaeon]
MEDRIIIEAIGRIPGLPTFSRIRKELMNKFNLRVREEELQEDLNRMMSQEKLEEREITIKGNRFKGYKIPEEDSEKKGKEEKSEEERIIDEVLRR